MPVSGTNSWNTLPTNTEGYFSENAIKNMEGEVNRRTIQASSDTVVMHGPTEPFEERSRRQCMILRDVIEEHDKHREEQIQGL